MAKPKSEHQKMTYSIRLSPDIVYNLQKLALTKKMTVSDLIEPKLRELLQEGVHDIEAGTKEYKQVAGVTSSKVSR